jgi:hypothetical protein
MPPKDRNFVPMGNKIIPVLDAPRVEQWLRLPWSIYSEDKNWIPHLLQDVAKVFDPTKNKLLKDGKAMRWVLEDEQGQVIGASQHSSIRRPRTPKHNPLAAWVSSSASMINLRRIDSSTPRVIG